MTVQRYIIGAGLPVVEEAEALQILEAWVNESRAAGIMRLLPALQSLLTHWGCVTTQYDNASDVGPTWRVVRVTRG